MTDRKSAGFALPTILIASLIMLAVLTVTMSSISAVLTGIKTQGYNQVARDGADAGLSYAESCLRQSNGVVTWSDSSPLTPATNCYGKTIDNIDCGGVSGVTDTRCFLSSQTNADGAKYFTAFSVGTPDYVMPGRYVNLHSTGYVYLISTTSGYVWRTYSQSSTVKANGSAGIVTDGLVMDLDADNPSSYSGGNTWDDLSEDGNSCTLINGPVYKDVSGAGTISFDGFNDYANCGSSPSLTSANVTYSVWVNLSSLDNSHGLLSKEEQYKMMVVQGYVKVLFSSNGASWTTTGQDSTTPISTDKWWNITMVVNSSGSKLYAYVNGNLIDTYSISAVTAYNTNPTAIGSYIDNSSPYISGGVNYSPVFNATYYLNRYADLSAAFGTDTTAAFNHYLNYGIKEGLQGSGELLNGKIGTATIYNRALSASEVEQNFEALRGRYGI